MVVLDDLKDLTMYKKQFFLPIDEDDKKHNSMIMLLTPNYQSSINAMKAPYIINRRYFESYYLEKNIYRYISKGKIQDDAKNESYLLHVNEADLTSQERNKLPADEFGLPSQRRYPMPDKKHVLLAIKFFNHVEEEYEKELAKNIIKKIKEFDMVDEVHVGEKNRFYPYWKKEFSSVVTEAASVVGDDNLDDEFEYYFHNDIMGIVDDLADTDKIVDDAMTGYLEGTVPLTEEEVEGEVRKGKLYPIFIVPSFTYTPFGKLAKKVASKQIHEYSHAAMGFGVTLNPLYSYNADNKVNAAGKGGFSIESLREYLKFNNESKISVSVFFVKAKHYHAIRKYVQDQKAHQKESRFATTNFLKILMGKFENKKPGSLKMICSQFVYSVLKQIGADPLHKDLVTPDELADYRDDLKVFNIYQGYARDYDPNKTKEKIETLIKTAVPMSEEAMLDENMIIDESTVTHKRVTSAVIVNDKHEVLVVSRNGSFEFPSVDVPDGMSDTSVALPEFIKSDFGIDIKEMKLLYTFSYGNTIGNDLYSIDNDHYIIQYNGKVSNLHPEKYSSVKFLSVGHIAYMIRGGKNVSKPLYRFVGQFGRGFMGTNSYISTKQTTSSIHYSGYERDVKSAAAYINEASLKAMFKKCKVKYPSDDITVIVSNSDEDYGYIDDTNITILSKSAFSAKYKDVSYSDYTKFITAVFVYHTINPAVHDEIVYPIATFMSGAINDQLNDPDNKKVDMERVIRSIYNKLGANALIDIVKKNGVEAIFYYAKKAMIEATNIPNDWKRIAIQEEEDAAAQTTSAAPATSSGTNVSGDVMTLDDIKDYGKKLVRRIKRNTVYKMNKIRRDMARGNVGTDSHDQTSIQKLQSGDLITTAPNAPAAPSSGEAPASESFAGLDQNSYFLLEDAINYDANLRDSLYADRIRNQKQILTIYKKVKADCPSIRFAYVDLDRYKNLNLYFDTSYYNESYFKNAVDLDDRTSLKTMRVYTELLKRLIVDNRLTGYKKKTIFIPVLDWRHNTSTRMWIYREDLNPISIIYNMMKTNPNELKSIFKGMDLVFMGANNYFKLSFDRVDVTKDNKVMIFSNLIKRLISLGFYSAPDPDPADEPVNSTKGIALDIVDKVEKSQNITIKSVKPIMQAKDADNPFQKDEPKPLDVAVKKVEADSTQDPKVIKKKVMVSDTFSAGKKSDKVITKQIKKTDIEIVQKTSKEDMIKATKIEKPSVNNAVNSADTEKQKEELLKAIVKAAATASNTDSAVDELDEEFKKLLIEIRDKEEENARVSKARATRIVELSNQFKEKEVDGKSVKDLLDTDPNKQELPHTKLKINTITKQWEDLSFMNFDKTYDPDADIVKMLYNMQNWSYPIAVRDIKVSDNSTAEDYLDLWEIQCEDYKGSRFKLKVDIPKFINDKFLKLRGNMKALMIQSTLMPIIKTDLDTCQIIGVGGYNKIFVRQYGGKNGKSMMAVDKLINTIRRYNGDDLIVSYGDNRGISNKYELPIDYIDLAGQYNSIETRDFVLYFNQDELRKKYVVDDGKGLPVGVYKKSTTKKEEGERIIYFNGDDTFHTVSHYITYLIMGAVDTKKFIDIYDAQISTGKRYMYSRASILSIKIPLVIVCAYVEGLVSTLKKAHIDYSFVPKLDKMTKRADDVDYIKFSDGYLVYTSTYSSSMLMNGLKSCDTESYSLKDINNKEIYMDFLTEFGGSIKSDGLDNSYDLMIDPITKELLALYGLPTDYVSVLLYANDLLADNKFIKHTDMSVRRLRRKELIAGYFYKALSTSYQSYANQIRHTRKATKMTMKQSSVIDMILSKDPSSGDLSINNCINDVEAANSVTSKGLVGMNTDRAYSLDKRGFDDSMLNVLGMSTGFSANVGINRQATIDCNIQGSRGIVKPIDGNADKLSTTKTLTITEALTPFGSTHDDPFRTLMTHIQTSKHMVRTEKSDPMLVTNGADEAMPFLVSDIFAFKAKKDGVVKELELDPKNRTSYMILEYKDGTHDFIDLSETIQKNSDGGYHVPMMLETDLQVGKKIKAGEVVAYDKSSFSNTLGESNNIAANIGTLAKVAIMNTDEGFEDSAAVTEGFASLLGTKVITKIDKTIDKNANVFLMKKIGDPIMEGDTLLSYQNSYDDDVANSLLRNLAMNQDEISDLGRNPVIANHTGILQDIRIYRTVDINELSPSLQKLVKAYEDPIKKKKNIYEQYGIDTAILPSTKKMAHTGTTKNVYDGVKIEFYVKYTDNMAIGDKIVFYSANKGVIKYIIPEGEEPYTEFRKEEPVDAFISIGSIQGRLVCSTPLFGSISKLMVELDRSVKDLVGIPYDTKRV